MNIFVCLKQVPDTGAVINMAPDQTSIDTNQIEYVINPYDEYALEEALLLKDNDENVNVTAITAGPPRCRQALNSALAVGADSGIFVDTREDRSYDSFFNANMVVKSIAEGGFDLVLCGLQGADYNNGQFPVYLARKLNVPVVTNIFSIDLEAENKSLQAVRLNADGSKTVFEVKLPAVISFSKGRNLLRYASLTGIMKAKNKEVVTVITDEVSASQHRLPFQIREMYQTEQERDNIVITDTDGTAVNSLFEYLVKNLNGL